MFPIILFTVSAFLTIASFFSQYGWWFDLASHFHLQYFLLQLICVVLCVFQKRKKLLILAGALAIINFSFLAPFYFPSSQKAGTSATQSADLSILLINLNSSNNQYGKVSKYIQEKNPDILALEEINQKWHQELKEVLSQFPYKEIVAREDNFGIALFSKIPTDEILVKYYGSVEVPSILTSFELAKQPVTLLFTHPVPPGSLQYFHWRNEQLNTIASNRFELLDNMILVGDLNTTSWSWSFQNFIERMKLKDSRRGFGLQITWPAMLPILGITIDHVLVSEAFSVMNHEIGPNIGSDHYPVYVELKFN
jgi:endonuclease/exonuclease/phosphatase (EEP) superfamily protein YafD